MLKLFINAVIIMSVWIVIICIWQIREDTVAWANEPFVYGPSDWKAKNADCLRRASLIGGWVEYRDDDRYCVVKKGGL